MTTPHGTTETAPSNPAVTQVSVTPPTAEDLITLLDLRERIEDYFERAGQAWLDRQVATNPNYKWVTNTTGWVVEFDRDALVYAYYADAWESRNQSHTEVRIPLGEFVPEYGAAREMLTAIGAA